MKPEYEKCEILHSCCDIFSKICKSPSCESVCADLVHNNDREPHTSSLSKQQQEELHQSLAGLRQTWCYDAQFSAYLLMGEEICTGLSNGAIRQIIANCSSINDAKQLLDLGIRLHCYCEQI